VAIYRIQRLRQAFLGGVNDEELADLVYAQIERFRAAGNLDASLGSDKWRNRGTRLVQFRA